MTERIRQQLLAADCELRFDELTCQLYATDASHYRIEPIAVAFPRNAAQAASIMRAAGEAGISITPRGAGSGLTGGALGDGVVMDFARYNQQIWDFNAEKNTVRVGAGVVLDQLNAFLKPHGLTFGPDVATSSRATIGGMIANNSSGARTPVYGVTADHVVFLECVLADGRVVSWQETTPVQRELEAAERIVRRHAAEIQQRMPAGFLKRWPGYGVDRCLRNHTLANLLAGSEGTLAGILAAELKLVPLPRETGLGLCFFASVAEAMQATVALLDLKPAAIEHIDDVLTDQTIGQREFKAARDLLDLDARPCKSMLIVEFQDNVREKLAAFSQRTLGLRSKVVTSAGEMNLVWSLRKAGLALLTGRKGRAKPVTCIEDAAVHPRDLPEYVAALEGILRPLDVEACFYGHAASGLLHVRPVLDLRNAADLKKFRRISEEVSSAVRQFRGSLAAEHGIGMARTEFMREHLGDELLGAMHAIKITFDPGNVLNPGKMFDAKRYRIDSLLHVPELKLSFEPTLAFAAKDESFLANLDQCNGCGGCRKPAPTMCPTFLVTGEERFVTRGRVNTIRAALEGRFQNFLDADELCSALDSCLSCKACTAECPSNVNMTLLKAELLHAAQERHGLTLAQRVLSRVDIVGAAASVAPHLANKALKAPLVRWMMQRALGIATERALPAYSAQRFDDWFFVRSNNHVARRGRVLLWDDCFVRHNEPEIGKSAVKVLERAGYTVSLLRNHACCGRPAFSQGNLDEARRMGGRNLELLAAESRRQPFESVVFLEPSCFSMFAEEYRELKLAAAPKFSGQAVLFENFVNDLLQREPDALSFRNESAAIAIHVHCHAKALTGPASVTQLARRLPGRAVTLLNTGCCGMAGAFGAMKDKYELSLKVAEPLKDQIRRQPAGSIIVASGTSCRQQIEHTTTARPLHIAQVIASALAG